MPTSESDSTAGDLERPVRRKRGPRSDKPQRILAYLRKYFAEYNYPPSVRDIVEGCNLSSTSVADYNLKILEREGHIRRDRERARTISLVEPVVPARVSQEPPLRLVPVLGRIAAGTRVFDPDSVDVNHAEEHIGVTLDMLGGREHENIFALTVRGDSMIDALIADSDTVILERTATVEDGQMAAVWLREENLCTLKRLFRERGEIRLQPENPTMDPIYTHPDNVEVQGRVVSIIRRPR